MFVPCDMGNQTNNRVGLHIIQGRYSLLRLVEGGG